MNILLYNELDYAKISKQFERVLGYLKAGNFRSADVRKMGGHPFYRAKLDDASRLLFKYAEVNGQKYLLILEVIYNHEYSKSRFMNGGYCDESQFVPVDTVDKLVPDAELPITYLNPAQKTFRILDKVLSFDDTQEALLQAATPLVIIGSAGSGKTALILEKLKSLEGRVLYVTLSSYLVENSRNLYYSKRYSNTKQDVEFMSFNDYLSAISIPQGKEVNFQVFDLWFARHRQTCKIKDAYRLYEEFKGVLTGFAIDKPYLSKAEYFGLGIKQSIFLNDEREVVYELFMRYLSFLNEQHYFDSNILSQQYLAKVTAHYDFVLIDEVQDLTNVQLALIMKSLHQADNFILCGDSNQVVHPNFFSWTNLRALFYQYDLQRNIIGLLATNYRNTPEVTQIANRLLLLKNARFGSTDKESVYLVKSNTNRRGEVKFMANTTEVKQSINERTQQSAQFAVIVMRPEDKAEARRSFKTPLLFSIDEVKGLEYDNIILYNVISGHDKEFSAITTGLCKSDLEQDMNFGRCRHKNDKSFDAYKFYVNALYVAFTRAVKNLYIIESQQTHPLLALLDLTAPSQEMTIKVQSSSKEEWQREAIKLDMQGKKEQAAAIRKNLLGIKPVPWEVVTRQNIELVYTEATNPEYFNKKAKDRLYNYALYYNDADCMDVLASLKYNPALPERWIKQRREVLSRQFAPYRQDNVKAIQQLVQAYGINFRTEQNLTPLMIAIESGATKVIRYLMSNQPDLSATDNYGRNILQHLIVNEVCEGKTEGLLSTYYHLLKKESLRLKINNRLIKIDSHQTEYLMLNYMLAVYPNLLVEYGSTRLLNLDTYKFPFFNADTIADFFERLDARMVPGYRKQRRYINSLFSKHEVNSEQKGNKELFIRAEKGEYCINPALSIWVDGEWINFYDLIQFDSLKTTALHLGYLCFYDFCAKTKLPADLKQECCSELCRLYTVITDDYFNSINQVRRAVKMANRKDNAAAYYERVGVGVGAG